MKYLLIILLSISLSFGGLTGGLNLTPGETTNTSALDGQPGTYYLNRTNHSGLIGISDISNLNGTDLTGMTNYVDSATNGTLQSVAIGNLDADISNALIANIESATNGLPEDIISATNGLISESAIDSKDVNISNALVSYVDGATNAIPDTDLTPATNYTDSATNNLDSSHISDFQTAVSNNPKLSGIAAGATANSSDATLLDRDNHTGFQPASTVSNFQSTVSNNGLFSLIATDSTNYSDSTTNGLNEAIVNATNQNLVDAKAYTDGATNNLDSSHISDFQTAVSNNPKLSGIAAGATANSSDATLLDRDNHTGFQPASTVSNFQSTVSNNGLFVKIALDASNYTDAATNGLGALGNYVEAFHDISISNTSTSLYQNLIFNSNAIISGWTHAVGSSNFTCNKTGSYLITYNAHVVRRGNNNATPELRVVVAGIEVPGSASVRLLNTKNAGRTMTGTTIANINSGQVLNMQFVSSELETELSTQVYIRSTHKYSYSITITRIN